MTGKSDVVLITGGLGPTSDDITKQTLCEFFNTRLVTDYEVLKMIEEMMRQRNWPMNDNNRRQADVPESCRVLKNAAGTAPGMWFEKDKTIFISMPGVPHEMKYIMNEHVIPELKKKVHITGNNSQKYYDLWGWRSKYLLRFLQNFEEVLPPEIKLAYLPAYGIIKLRLTATGSDKNMLNRIVQEQVRKSIWSLS